MSTLRWSKAGILAGFLVLSLPLQAADLERRQSELKAIQAQISQQQSALKSTGKQRERLIALLKQDEKAIADAAGAINRTQGESAKVSTKLQQLKQRSEQLERLKQSQQQSLSKQLASAYLAGSHDYSKMLLNQQSPATIERMLAYYQYLNKARIKAIDQLKLTLDELQQVRSQQLDEQSRLERLIVEQKDQAKRLGAEQSQRQLTLNELQKTLSERGAELEQLQIEEASLKRVVEEALRAAKESPSMKGLASQRGKLGWPTKGALNVSYGSTRSGQIKWKGVMLAAPEGQNVFAIAPGKVIFADWLRGFGMVMVVDHGEGYMSLYGHAQALLKEAGDTVQTGDAIALVGRSGGQTEPGLYFEIRHKGQAVDPAGYCRR
ncbi:peptidoglycan DD-metalloendopeptidase family protein [Shewanella cyperi]|uniref:Peptidoglycan DD-metalloendopeptidase family protein n=2 Tax=Shewanella TaxID=22 RepID=A0A974XKT2_9GAMM|nr:MULTISPECIES: peptidoglycan DD-metalloendopeptidase family protein [Shewanella]QSX30149.1 peptidoglycan DD-metalloendopeptidase family protein [Shewanella cyperi]QSX37326.1 peptidoglycan DD-metalloendopeptidase family protein [Shewanella sedimentimangrovi]